MSTLLGITLPVLLVLIILAFLRGRVRRRIRWMSWEPSGTQETVVIVHGTFAQGNGDSDSWYVPGSRFCKMLDDMLRDLGSPARCWAHGGEVFRWSGRNDWRDRARASDRLARYLEDLHERGWRTHIIAHSHGGNVVMDAVGALSPGPRESWHQGNVVTLGTPFLEAAPPKRSDATARIVGWAGAFLILIGSYLAIAQSLPGSLLGWLAAIAAAIVMGVIWFVAVYYLGMLLLVSRDARIERRLLVLHSRHDEALQLLGRVASLPNPFVRGGRGRGRSSAIFEAARAWGGRVVGTWARADRLRHPPGQGLIAGLGLVLIGGAIAVDYAPSWLADAWIGAWIAAALLFVGFVAVSPEDAWSVIALPLRLFRFAWSFVRAVGAWLVSLVVARAAWPFLKSFAVGLQGHPFELRDVGAMPAVDDAFCLMLEIPDDVANTTLRRRSKSFGQFSDLLAEAALEPALPIKMIREGIGHDHAAPFLVHCSYYADSAVVKTMATWVARSNKEIRRAADVWWELDTNVVRLASLYKRGVISEEELRRQIRMMRQKITISNLSNNERDRLHEALADSWTAHGVRLDEHPQRRRVT